MSCLRMTLHGKNELATGNFSFLLQSLTVLLPFFPLCSFSFCHWNCKVPILWSQKKKYMISATLLGFPCISKLINDLKICISYSSHNKKPHSQTIMTPICQFLHWNSKPKGISCCANRKIAKKMFFFFFFKVMKPSCALCWLQQDK